MMSTRADGTTVRLVRRDRLSTIGLWAAWACASATTIAWAHHTGNGPGTMGLGPAAFELMWALMMAAMMLPSAIRATKAQPANGTALAFAAGYLTVWSASGIPAYLAATGAGRLAGHHPTAAAPAAAAVFAVAGLYQLSATKDRATRHCEAPPHDSSAVISWRRGMSYGGWCLAGSWAAMAVLLVVGVMNVAAMILVAAALYAERFWLPNRAFRRLVAITFLGVAPAAWLLPSVAVGLRSMAPMPK